MRAAVLALCSAAAIAAAEPCSECHPNEAAALARSGMGRSFREVSGRAFAAGAFRHPASDSTVEIRGSRHAILARGQKAERSVHYAVGSGKAGASFLVRQGEWLYQSPAAYFTARHAWGPSPGYEADPVLDFSRPIPDECVFCHAGSSNWVPGSINRFATPPGSLTGIPCGRCHGDGALHMKRPSRSNIVNPARLDGAVRDSVCEQCHLAGTARVLNPGKRWQDFSPGASLQEAWSVYVPEQGDPRASLAVVSHVEQLAASSCARGSQGKLWCGSCHSVHSANTDPSASCRTCHPVSHERDRTLRQSSCANCHMPKRRTFDGGHTAFTDHRIQKRPVSGGQFVRNAPRALRVWRPGPNEARNEGLAYIQAGDRLLSEELVQRGFRLLASRQREFEGDAEVLAALGYVLLRKNRPRESATLLERAVRLEPRNVRFQVNLGLALADAGQRERARAVLADIRRIDPSIELADRILKQISEPDRGSENRK